MTRSHVSGRWPLPTRLLALSLLAAVPRGAPGAPLPVAARLSLLSEALVSGEPVPGGPVMFLGAHPDDEAIAAPLLGELCVEEGRRCRFLVATRGESGLCRLPGGCVPGLGAVRAEEMRRAAAVFGAVLTQWELPDVLAADPGTVRRIWDESAGGDAALVARIAWAIAAEAPGAVITFDPRHGSTCHTAHRALGSLVLDAVKKIPNAPAVFLLETRVFSGEDGFGFSAAVPGDARVLAFDANTLLSGGAGTAWDFLRRDAAAHASQFDQAALDALAAVAAEDRRVTLLPSADLDLDPRYEGLCAPGPAFPLPLPRPVTPESRPPAR